MEFKLDNNKIEEIIEEKVKITIENRVNKILNKAYTKEDYLRSEIESIVDRKVSNEIDRIVYKYIEESLRKIGRDEMIKIMSNSLSELLTDKLIDDDEY